MDGKRVSKDNSTLWTEVVDKTYVPYQENSQGIVDIREGDSVQIVIEHFAMRNNSTNCIIHPWHLHGHSYYVVGYGKDDFKIDEEREIEDNLRYGNKIPILRDTFTHYPDIVDQNQLQAKAFNFKISTLKVAFSENQDFTAVKSNININNNPDEYVSCGWYAIRFIADNPGSWFMHCHITPHLIMGKYHIINELPRNYHINRY
ncbi:Cupredoxin [Neoconidiobolus thromboides FSU 785]|nr:Cupredoxin [Neoconidiobolus thromboides FSU 785]